MRYPVYSSVTFNKLISNKCNFNCSYCLAKLDKNHTKIEDNPIIYDLIEKNFSFCLTGDGEPLLEFEKIIDICNNIKNNNSLSEVLIMTNGSQKDKIEYLLKNYSFVKFVHTIKDTNDKTSHNNLNTFCSNRVKRKVLVDINDDLEAIIKKYPNDTLKFISRDNILENYKDSLGYKQILNNKSILERFVNKQLLTHGVEIECTSSAINLDNSVKCGPKFEIKSDVFTDICNFKDNNYFRLSQNKECCCLKKENNIEYELLKLYDDYDLYIKYRQDLESEVNLIDPICKENLNILINQVPLEDYFLHSNLFYRKYLLDIAPLFGFKLRFLKFDLGMNQDKYGFHGYEDIIVTDFNKLNMINDNKMLVILLPLPNYLYQIIGYKDDIIKLFSNPYEYGLKSDLQTKIFRYLLRRITN